MTQGVTAQGAGLVVPLVPVSVSPMLVARNLFPTGNATTVTEEPGLRRAAVLGSSLETSTTTTRPSSLLTYRFEPATPYTLPRNLTHCPTSPRPGGFSSGRTGATAAGTAGGAGGTTAEAVESGGVGGGGCASARDKAAAAPLPRAASMISGSFVPPSPECASGLPAAGA